MKTEQLENTCFFQLCGGLALQDEGQSDAHLSGQSRVSCGYTTPVNHLMQHAQDMHPLEEHKAIIRVNIC